MPSLLFSPPLQLTGDDWEKVVGEFKGLVTVPVDPQEQLHLAIEAVFKSWFTPRAVRYRAFNNIPDDLVGGKAHLHLLPRRLPDPSGKQV